MPVTPFHFGPGLLLKAVGGRHLSFGAFVAVQCVIDVESVANILLGRYPVHDVLHTFVGALSVGLLVGLLVPVPLSRLYGWLVQIPVVLALGKRLRWLDPPRPEQLRVSRSSALVGGVLGGATHVLLDATMHSDMQPFAPLGAHNPLLIHGSFVWTHVVCLVVGFLTLGLWPILSPAARQ